MFKKLVSIILTITLLAGGVIMAPTKLHAQNASESTMDARNMSLNDLKDHMDEWLWKYVKLTIYGSDDSELDNELGLRVDDVEVISITPAIKQGQTSHVEEKIEIANNIESLKGIHFFTNIDTVALWKTGISSFPNEVFQLPNLKKLSVTTYTKFTSSEILDSFDLVPDLSTLQLVSNKTGDFVVEQLPESFYNLKNLKQLNLNNVGLKSLPFIPNIEKLTKLELTGNSLEELPKNFDSLSNEFETPLMRLNLSNNKIGNMTLEGYKKLLNLPLDKHNTMLKQKYETYLPGILEFSDEILLSNDSILNAVYKSNDYVKYGQETSGSKNKIDVTLSAKSVDPSKSGKDPKISLSFEDVMSDNGIVLKTDVIQSNLQFDDYTDFALEFNFPSKIGLLNKSNFIFNFSIPELFKKDVIYQNALVDGELLPTYVIRGRQGTQFSISAPGLEYQTLITQLEDNYIMNDANPIVLEYEYNEDEVTINLINSEENSSLGVHKLEGKHTTAYSYVLPKFEGLELVDQTVDKIDVIFDLSLSPEDKTINVYYKAETVDNGGGDLGSGQEPEVCSLELLCSDGDQDNGSGEDQKPGSEEDKDNGSGEDQKPGSEEDKNNGNGEDQKPGSEGDQDKDNGMGKNTDSEDSGSNEDHSDLRNDSDKTDSDKDNNDSDSLKVDNKLENGNDDSNKGNKEDGAILPPTGVASSMFVAFSIMMLGLFLVLANRKQKQNL